MIVHIDHPTRDKEYTFLVWVNIQIEPPDEPDYIRQYVLDWESVDRVDLLVVDKVRLSNVGPVALYETPQLGRNILPIIDRMSQPDGEWPGLWSAIMDECEKEFKRGKR